jgi:general stress protein 26
MTATTHPSGQVKWNDIRDGKLAMFTTSDANGSLRSRPLTMKNTALDANDSLWFFMAIKSDSIAGPASEPSVNVAYSPPSDARWTSVTGTALVVEGGDKARFLWKRSAAAWSFGGPTDPDFAIVQARMVHASEWQAGADFDFRPALRSEHVGYRPPNHLPTETTRASENAALPFERS